MADPNYRLPPLPRAVRDRIDQSIAHQTYWIRDGGWGLDKIRDWRADTLARFAEDLRESQPALGTIFDDYIGQHRDEIIEYG